MNRDIQVFTNEDAAIAFLGLEPHSIASLKSAKWAMQTKLNAKRAEPRG